MIASYLYAEIFCPLSESARMETWLLAGVVITSKDEATLFTVLKVINFKHSENFMGVVNLFP